MFIRTVTVLLLVSLLGCAGGGRAPVEDRKGGANSSTLHYVVQRGDTLYSIAFRYGLDYRKVAEVNSISPPYTIYPGQTLYLWKLSSAPAYVAAPPETPPPASLPTPPPIISPAPATGVVVTAVPDMAGQSVASPTPPQPVYQGGTPAKPAPAATAAASTSAPTPAATPVTSPAVVAKPAPVTPPPATQPPPPAAPGGKVTAWLWPASGKVTRGYSSSVHKGIDIGGNRGDPVYAVADGVVVYAGTGIVGFGELLIVKHNDVYLSAYGHNSRLLVRENEVVRAGQRIAEKGSSGTDTVKLHFEIRKEGKPIDPLRLLPRR